MHQQGTLDKSCNIMCFCWIINALLKVDFEEVFVAFTDIACKRGINLWKRGLSPDEIDAMPPKNQAWLQNNFPGTKCEIQRHDVVAEPSVASVSHLLHTSCLTLHLLITILSSIL